MGDKTKNFNKYDYSLLNHASVSRFTKKNKFLCTIFVSFVLWICYCCAPSLESVSDFLKTFTKNEPKYVLFWTRFGGEISWVTGPGSPEEIGEEMLKSVDCPVTNCIFTHNRTLTNLTNFDAILFYIPSIGSQPSLNVLPQSRSEKQLYIVVSLESPLAFGIRFDEIRDFFNLTMTYRIDSDVQWDYGKVIDKETNEIVAPSKAPKWREVDEDFYDEEIMQIIKNKTSPIAWFVSNCGFVPSHRDQFAKEINKTMQVDIYGACGTLQCPRFQGNKCEDLLEEKYRFYFSFENALCKSYVTEKLYRPLDRYVIPVVYNGADTSLFAPPKSYIDANSFKDIEELTDYLQYLTDNPREYIKYFWWKKHFKLAQHSTYAYTYCDLCKKLNDPKFMSEKHQYEDIKAWWMGDPSGSVCGEPKIQFDHK